MAVRTTIATAIGCVLTLSAVLAWPALGAAQEAAGLEGDSPAEQASNEPASEAEGPPAEPAPPPGEAPPAQQEDTEPDTLGPLERLPASAYPDEPVRGIRGGSLWFTFHGLQWPYYPKTGIGVSGYAWVDTGYERVKRGNPSEQSIKYMLQQGRVLLRVTPAYTAGDWFVQAQAELVANKDQSSRQPDIADADDVWLRVGNWRTFDVQFGRFEGWEVYHFGMGLDLNTLERQGATDDVYGVPEIYGVTYAFYRPPGLGQFAVHVYPFQFFRVELAGQIGNEFGSNALAGRPVGVLDLGFFKLKLGGEYKKLNDQKDGAQGETIRRGVGASAQFVLDPFVEFGVNGGYALVDRTAPDGAMDEKGSFTTWSVGGFANARVVGELLIGGGVNLTHLHDLHYDEAVRDNGQFGHTQAFVALQYVLWGQLYIKVVGAYAASRFEPTFGEPQFSNHMLSARLRLMYLF
jgi:hypothetical protein